MKKLLSVLLVFAVLFGLGVPVTAQSETEIPEGYTPVYTAEDLNNIRNNLSGKYILMNDIDLSVYENWEPIGTQETPFMGELDGSDNIISNLTIDKEYNENDTMYWGLFGYISGGVNLTPSVKNVRVDKASIILNYNGENSAEIHVGIISGYCGVALIENCAVAGDLKVSGFTKSQIGGIVGNGIGTDFELCANYSNIEVCVDGLSTEAYVGGLFGCLVRTTEQKCCNYGNISITESEKASDCRIVIGGIEGMAIESFGITDCFNRGEITIDAFPRKADVGGIAGIAYQAHNLYNSEEIILKQSIKYIGALLGDNSSGALAFGDPPEITNSYYSDNEMLPVRDGTNYFLDLVEDPSYNVRCLSEEEFKTATSFTGLDFESVWAMEENGYPVLQNQPMINVKEEISLEVGETFDGDLTDCKWSIENETIAAINENGKIIGLSAGETILTVEIEYGYSYEYTITVTEPEPPVEEPTDPTPPVEEPDEPNEECYFVKILTYLWSSFKWAIFSIFDTIADLFN